MNWLLIIAAFPLLWRVLVPLVPPQYIEPYAFWDPISLNTAGADGRVPRWRNMGYWATGQETFTEANVALADKLVAFADAKLDGRTLDLAHGAGESLLIHIQNGATVDALTSLPGETAQASALVESWATAGGVSPAITFFTASGGFRPNKDLDHPLNPMRGYMGETNQDVISEDDDEEDDSEEEQEEEAKPIDAATLDAEATRYDLVYVLDAAYHFPPSVSYFANSVLPVLKPGSGVLAYTDVLPPAKLSRFPLMLTAGWLAPLLNLPRENINERPASVDDYVAHLGRIGYENVRIEDWTEHVFAPLAANLEARGGLWWAYAQLIRLAERTGWKFVAVRGQRPQLSA